MNPALDLRLVAISPDDAGRRSRLVHDLGGLAEGGVTAFMFREKSLAEDEFVALGRSLRQRCDELGLAFILNERTESIEPIGARAVHLTWRSRVSARVCRERSRDGLLIGRSVHDGSEALAARDEGCDYLIYGPVFATPSKAGLVPTRGLAGLAALTSSLDLPVIAVGGIEAKDLAPIRAAGATGIAAIRAFFTDDPRAAAATFKAAWEELA